MGTAAGIALLLAHCRAAVGDHAAPLLSLALAGLLSGFSHCAMMCGPFMLAQAGHRLAAMPLGDAGILQRAVGAAALPYQLGRATTYTLLGALVAGGLGRLLPSGIAAPVAATMLIAAMAMILLRRDGRLVPAALVGRPLDLAGRLLAPLFRHPLGWTGFSLGLVLGLLPCGVVYGALLLAASTGDALAGGFGMLMFALGTMPGLALVGVVGHLALGRWRGRLQQLPAMILLLNALSLLAMNVRLILA